MADRNYTTSAKMANFLGVTISEDVSAFILATQKFIEELTGRIFKADAAASSRVFNGEGGQILHIDDCTEITLVELGDNAYGDSFSTIQDKSGASSSDHYITLPSNNASKEVPINRLFLRARFWIIGVENHRITAKWGWSTIVPDDVSQAATIIAAGMYNANRLKGAGNVRSEKIGNYSVSFDVEGGQSKWNDLEAAKLILNSYKKHLL